MHNLLELCGEVLCIWGGILSNAYLSARGVGLISYIIPNLKNIYVLLDLHYVKYTHRIFLFPYNLGHVQQSITPSKKKFNLSQNQLKISPLITW